MYEKPPKRIPIGCWRIIFSSKATRKMIASHMRNQIRWEHLTVFQHEEQHLFEFITWWGFCTSKVFIFNQLNQNNINTTLSYTTIKNQTLTWDSAWFAVPENNLSLVSFLLTVLSTRADSKNLGKVWSLRTGIAGFPFPKFNGPEISHFWHNK